MVDAACGRIVYLAGAVANADLPPTDQMREVHRILRERLAAAQADLQRVLESELPEAVTRGPTGPEGGPGPTGEHGEPVSHAT